MDWCRVGKRVGRRVGSCDPAHYDVHLLSVPFKRVLKYIQLTDDTVIHASLLNGISPAGMLHLQNFQSVPSSLSLIPR